MWTVQKAILPEGDRWRYRIEGEAGVLSYLEVVELWHADARFREFFSRVLRDSPYRAFRWETPAVTRASAHQPFECVLLDSPWLGGPADPADFTEHFAGLGSNTVATFANLGGDATRVASPPSPGPEPVDYGHLGAWLRNAPTPQLHALWIALATAVENRLGSRPLWLSTAGGGVPWLHFRLDDRPKYYGHGDYRNSAW